MTEAPLAAAPSTQPAPGSAGRRNAVLAALAFALPWALYLATACPGLGWGNPAKFALMVKEGQVVFAEGGSHGLHVLLGMLFARLPLLPGDVPYRLTLLSALVAALATFATYRLFLRLSVSPPAALAGALAFALTSRFWHCAVIGETYPLFVLLLVTQLSLLLRWRERQELRVLGAFLAVMAVSFLAHMLTVLFAPLLLLAALAWARRGRPLLLAFGAAAVLVAAGLALQPHAASELARTALEHYRHYISALFIAPQLADFPRALFGEFSLLGVPVGLYGLWRAAHERRGHDLLLVAIFVADVLFASAYTFSRHLYLLVPAYLVFAFYVARGFDALYAAARSPRGVTAAVALALAAQPVAAYGMASYVARQSKEEIVPTDDLRFLLPWKPDYHDVEQFADEALATADGGVIIGRHFILSPLRYALQTRPGARGRVRLLFAGRRHGEEESQARAWIFAAIDRPLSRHRRVFLIGPHDLVFLSTERAQADYWVDVAARYTLERRGPLWEVTGWKSGPPPDLPTDLRRGPPPSDDAALGGGGD